MAKRKRIKDITSLPTNLFSHDLFEFTSGEMESSVLNKVEIQLMLKQLTPKEQDMLVLWAYYRCSYEEIAEYMNKKYETNPPGKPVSWYAYYGKIGKLLKRLQKINENSELILKNH